VCALPACCLITFSVSVQVTFAYRRLQDAQSRILWALHNPTARCVLATHHMPLPAICLPVPNPSEWSLHIVGPSQLKYSCSPHSPLTHVAPCCTLACSHPQVVQGGCLARHRQPRTAPAGALTYEGACMYSPLSLSLNTFSVCRFNSLPRTAVRMSSKVAVSLATGGFVPVICHPPCVYVTLPPLRHLSPFQVVQGCCLASHRGPGATPAGAAHCRPHRSSSSSSSAKQPGSSRCCCCWRQPCERAHLASQAA
jgi:hypothetical protein